MHEKMEDGEGMGIDIRKYQEAYEIGLQQFKGNSQVLAVVVYGSMVSGDIWDESDIDFLIITEEKNKLESIYSRINNVPLHINYTSKDIFEDSYKNLLKGGTFHKAFFTGKLVYCKDDSIEEIFLSTRFYADKDRNFRNIEILSNVLKGMHYAKKYYMTGKYETAYQWCNEMLISFARLLMNIKGHITDKDILSFAVNMSSEVENLFNILNSTVDSKSKVRDIFNYIEEFLNSNLEEIASPIVEHLKKVKAPCSVEDINNSTGFRQLDFGLNGVLEKLNEAGIIKDTVRKYTTYGDEYLIDEIVYYVD